MNRYFFPVLFGCLVISLPVDTFAKGNGNGRMGLSQAPIFSDIDINLDGLISEEEFMAFQEERQERRKSEGRLLRNSTYSDNMFERIDIDHDRFLDIDEFESHRGSMRSSGL